MKRIVFLLFISIGLVGCVPDDNFVEYRYEFLAIEETNLPESFNFGEIHTINFYYRLPTKCHLYSGFYFEKNGNERVVAIQAIVNNKSICDEIPDDAPLSLATIKFNVQQYEPYVFKLFKGFDDNGNSIFEEILIEVN